MVAFLWFGALVSIAFEPPTIADCAKALGPLEDEPAVLQRLLTPDEDFAPIHRPGTGDWLTSHPERGQTFGDYCAGSLNRPTGARHVIYLLPLGAFPADTSPPLEELRVYAEAYFQLKVKILTAVTPDETKFTPRTNAFTHKRQLLSTGILSFLQTQLPADAYCLLGITMEDLYPAPSWNFVFGQASLTNRVGIYSFARYDPAFFDRMRPDGYQKQILQRSCKVLAHETAHMFGLAHCIYYECLTNGSNNLAETDASPQYLCPICLRKLHYNVQFDAVTRYEELARFYRRHEWDDDVRWVERQLEKAKKSE